MSDVLNAAIVAAENGQQTYCKFLSANDTGATGGHQYGVLLSRKAMSMFFGHVPDEAISKSNINVVWNSLYQTSSCLTWYESKHELRLTRFGRNFEFITPEQTGSLFVLVKQDKDIYAAFVLDTDDDIEGFFYHFGFDYNTVDNAVFVGRQVSTDIKERQKNQEIQNLISKMGNITEFPSTDVMSEAARNICYRVYGDIEQVIKDPDAQLMEWCNTEYTLFRAVENILLAPSTVPGAISVEWLLSMAQSITNRRKSRAGKSLENHLAAVFSGNRLQFSCQVVTEGHKKADFMFPSGEAYHDASFSSENLIFLAAKTTCKDRWRQILNEADRLRDSTKYLFTLQKGISPAQLSEMQAERVQLVIPGQNIASFPPAYRMQLLNLKQFTDIVKQKQNHIGW